VSRFVCSVSGALLLIAVGVSPVFAQGPYVGVSLGSDITRFNGVADQSAAGEGEAVSWQLKIGTPVASHFGVELEFSRPQEVTRTDSTPIATYSFTATSAIAAIGGPADLFLPSVSVRTAQRNTTIAPTFWVRQTITPRFAIAYLGGISFFRTTTEFSYDFASTGRPNVFAPTLLPRPTRSIEYGVGPVVGLEGRIGMTEHLQLVPELRMQTLTGGWLVRPSVGISWDF